MSRPYKEGISREQSVNKDLFTGPPLKRLKAGATLSDLQKDFELFTYAPLFLYGGLEHNPIQEWINLHNHKEVVFILAFDTMLIDLGCTHQLNSTIWAVEKEYWPSLELHIGSIGLVDKAKKLYVKALCQKLPVPDAALITRKRIIFDAKPEVTITTFSVDSNIGCLAFVYDLNPVEVPKLTRLPAREETVKFAKALFSEQRKPYEAVQP